jgi:DNA polymerase zeta
VASQEALEFIPLVFEPQSGVYTDPVAVLDFQSLYPSMIIAYNLCFSTCLGRLDPLRVRHEGQGIVAKPKLGVLPYPEETTVRALSDVADRFGRAEALRCFVSPSGAVFVSRRVRCGVLPRMLHEILQTRFMVKAAMKKYRDRPVLQRVLNARQFALKMVANVTYGYASASFSGRMPMAELADAIVSTAKRTLTNAVARVHEDTAPWAPGEVVYGDTDSLFVCLRGRARDDAIRCGQAIAKRVTADNPRNVVLKFDKVSTQEARHESLGIHDLPRSPVPL